jgi:hypothetical protein
MKRKNLMIVALACSLLISLAFVTAGLSGRWVGTVTTPDGQDAPAIFVLKFENGKLTGTTQTPSGVVDIEKGVSDGTNFSFSIGDGAEKIVHTGKYYAQGDSVSMTIDLGTLKMHTTLKRAPAEK